MSYICPCKFLSIKPALPSLRESCAYSTTFFFFRYIYLIKLIIKISTFSSRLQFDKYICY